MYTSLNFFFTIPLIIKLSVDIFCFCLAASCLTPPLSFSFLLSDFLGFVYVTLVNICFSFPSSPFDSSFLLITKYVSLAFCENLLYIVSDTSTFSNLTPQSQ